MQCRVRSARNPQIFQERSPYAGRGCIGDQTGDQIQQLTPQLCHRRGAMQRSELIGTVLPALLTDLGIPRQDQPQPLIVAVLNVYKPRGGTGFAPQKGRSCAA
jgi:hypothetical protein